MCEKSIKYVFNATERMKSTSVEKKSTGVLAKTKHYLRLEKEAKIVVKLTHILLFRTRLPKHKVLGTIG